MKISDQLGATPSTGVVGESGDHAMVEAVNGLSMTRLMRPQGRRVQV
ncbi:hypothetical protein [uncultured Amnibacterium sp.]